MKKLLRYLVMLSVLSNLASSLLFADGKMKQFSDPQNISAALGFWFLAATCIGWLASGVVYLLLRRNNTK